ncbi:MAG TPA: TonB family protein [Terriglobia bacterium]|jgi:TonB family protein|nr:TonB family protein [Terriglobia bacterium]
MKDEIDILRIQFADERASYRKREAFLSSVVLHLLLIIFILVGPKLFPRSAVSKANADLASAEKQDLGFLALPKDYQKLQRKPKTPLFAEKDRIAQGKSPKVDPKGLQAPYSEGNTKNLEQSAPAGPPEPPAPAVAAQPQSPPPQPPVAPAQENKQIAKLQLPQPSEARPQRSLQEISDGLETPGFSVKKSIEQARVSGNYGQGGPGGDSLRNFDNRQANFSVEEPTILSDTLGVDFGSWLRLVYYRVRDNWYAVIPELIRSGTKGKVVIIFDIHTNGRIDNLQVVRSSGLSPYDRAAVSSLKLSEPFPSFPHAFKGQSLTLQFSYLYNSRL